MRWATDPFGNATPGTTLLPSRHSSESDGKNWGQSKNGCFIMDNPMKMDDLGFPPHFSKPLCPCWLVRIGDCNILQPGFLGIITTHHGEYGFLGILTTHHGEDMLTRFLVDMLTTIYHPSWGMLSNQFFSPCGMTGSLPGSIRRSL